MALPPPGKFQVTEPPDVPAPGTFRHCRDSALQARLDGSKREVFNLFTTVNGAGLETDVKVLRSLLEGWGCQVNLVQTGSLYTSYADVNVFLEIPVPQAFSSARENWVVPNPEWWRAAWNEYLPRFDWVLCKTRDCLRIWTGLVGPERCLYTGFESPDLFKPEVLKRPEFLHLAGYSVNKNTEAVIGAWLDHRVPYPLTVVSAYQKNAQLCQRVPNVTFVDRLSPEGVAQMMNECQFHLCPSAYEGWGHYLHEALGCGAVVITTDAPPMSEFSGVERALFVPVSGQRGQCLAQLSLVQPRDVFRAVEAALNLSPERILEVGDRARLSFLSTRETFRSTLRALVGG